MPYRTGATDLQDNFVDWNTGYRLPTEAEWEKAARGGATGLRYPWGHTLTDGQANTGPDPTFSGICPVGYFAPNGYEIYDTAGNIFEWCWDRYSTTYYSISPAADPRGHEASIDRALRGGSYLDGAFSCRTAYRSGLPPTHKLFAFGFRSVLPLIQ